MSVQNGPDQSAWLMPLQTPWWNPGLPMFIPSPWHHSLTSTFFWPLIAERWWLSMIAPTVGSIPTSRGSGLIQSPEMSTKRSMVYPQNRQQCPLGWRLHCDVLARVPSPSWHQLLEPIGTSHTCTVEALIIVMLGSVVDITIINMDLFNQPIGTIGGMRVGHTDTHYLLI